MKAVEDLTSQTFMAALEGIRSFRGAGSFAAWIWVSKIITAITTMAITF